nr:hypothetical protein [Cressdnaviricota sp.]UOF82854.1 hypothetical protein [Cressdnaviricota sp.]
MKYFKRRSFKRSYKKRSYKKKRTPTSRGWKALKPDGSGTIEMIPSYAFRKIKPYAKMLLREQVAKSGNRLKKLDWTKHINSMIAHAWKAGFLQQLKATRMGHNTALLAHDLGEEIKPTAQQVQHQSALKQLAHHKDGFMKLMHNPIVKGIENATDDFQV